MKDYALDIGANPKTLSNWVAIYKNVLVKIGIEDPTIDEWRKARKVSNVLKTDRIIENKKNNAVGTRGAYKKSVPSNRVKNLFDSIEEKPFIGELNTITASAKYIKDVLKKRDLSIAPESRLLHLMEVLDDASEFINDHLTKVKRRAS